MTKTLVIRGVMAIADAGMGGYDRVMIWRSKAIPIAVSTPILFPLVMNQECFRNFAKI